MEVVSTCSLSESFEEIPQTLNQRTEFFFGDIHFLEDIPLLCLGIAKLEQLECKRLFVGAFANTYFSVVGLGNVKKVVVETTIYVSCVQKLFCYFFTKCLNFERTGNLLFDRHQLL